MAKRRLVVVTNSYPDAGSAEKTFIMPELLALSTSQFNVTLMPVRLPREIDPDLPRNMAVDYRYARSFRPWGVPAGLAGAMLLPLVWQELASHTYLALRSRFWKEAIRVANARRVFRQTDWRGALHYTFWFTGDTVGLATIPGMNVVTRVHGYDLYEEVSANDGYIPFRRGIRSDVRLVVALSRQAASYLRARFGFAADQIACVPLGVADQQLGPLPDDATLVIVSCSNASANKRINEIARMIPRIASRHPEKTVVWHHFGADREEPKFVSEFSDGTSAIFHGKVSNDQLLKFYRETAVSWFVNLSLSEGMPVSIMEAMSFGIPVLAPAVGGIPEMLERGGGVLISAGATGIEAADFLEGAMTQPQWRQILGAQAQAAQRSLFSGPRNAALMVDVLEGRAIEPPTIGSSALGARDD